MGGEWLNPICGGVLISVSLSTFVLINKNQYGVGQMLQNAVEKYPSDPWNNQILFLIGLIISPVTYSALFYPIIATTFQSEPLILIISGLLIGAGYKLCDGGLITRTVISGYSNFKTTLTLLFLFLFFGAFSKMILISLMV